MRLLSSLVCILLYEKSFNKTKLRIGQNKFKRGIRCKINRLKLTALLICGRFGGKINILIWFYCMLYT